MGTGEAQVEVGVLGPLEVTPPGGHVLELGGPRLRTLLALLVADARRVVSMAALVDGLWGAGAPPDAQRTVRAYVSRLRATLRASAGQTAEALIATRPPGYVLLVEPDLVDAARFERLAADGRRAMQQGQPGVAADRLTAALAQWRGEAYGEFTAPALRAEARRLTQLRMAAVQDRVDADLATGLGGELIAELEGLTARYPGHERLWGQLMIALYRAGRQADALATFRQARSALVEGAGLEPSPGLLDVHRQVLAQDAGLLPATTDRRPGGTPAGPVPGGSRTTHRPDSPDSPDGAAGAAGANGPAGPDGPDGPANADGAAGSDGPASADGANGPAGMNSPAGPAGAGHQAAGATAGGLPAETYGADPDRPPGPDRSAATQAGVPPGAGSEPAAGSEPGAGRSAGADLAPGPDRTVGADPTTGADRATGAGVGREPGAGAPTGAGRSVGTAREPGAGADAGPSAAADPRAERDAAGGDAVAGAAGTAAGDGHRDAGADPATPAGATPPTTADPSTTTGRAGPATLPPAADSPPPAAEPLPPAAQFVVPNQLPAAARYFTGREQPLARLVEAPGGARTSLVCAVDGMAGVGKTAVAVLAAHQLAESGRFPDGTLFVDLHGYSGGGPTDPAEALAAMLRGLGVPGPQVPADLDARAGLYRSLTARRRLLIVLDNARDEAQVRPLLPGTATCLVLITSRRRLAGLDDADHVTLDTLPPADAVRLFAAVAGPGRDLGGPRVVERIVRECGWLPLAIRVAAARLRASRAWTGPLLLHRLQATQDRLAELDDGERSVAAAFTVSYQQLPADQQRAFAALGLHPGLEYEAYAAAALLDCTPAAAGRLLAGLEQANLLDQPGAGRYRFHDLIRSYAASTAADQPPADGQAALDRLYGHYAAATAAATALAYPDDAADRLAAVPPATPAPPLPSRPRARAWLDSELPNLLATARHAAEHGRPEHIRGQSAALQPHLRARGHYTDARALHRHALAAARAAGDPPAEVAALNHLGDIHRMQDRYDEAADCHAQALAAARAVGDPAGEITALNGLAWVHRLQGRYGESIDCHTQALDAARATGDRTGEIDALLGLGWIHVVQGRYAAAGDCCNTALHLARTAGSRQAEHRALTGLGQVHHALGRHALATDCHTQALEAARAIGYRVGELTALTCLGWLHYERDRYGPAADCHSEALRTARELGDRHGQAVALTGLGDVQYAQGRHLAAADCYQQALDLATLIGNRNWQFEAQFGLGRTYQATGNPRLALTTHEHALGLADELDHPADRARAHDAVARAHDALGDTEAARHHWQQALDILTSLRNATVEGVSAPDLRARLAALPTPDPAHPR